MARLTDISLRRLKPRSTQYAVFDDVLPNFGVRVGRSGSLSFFVMYRVHGRRRRDTLGKFPILSLAKARKLARQRLAKLIVEDRNPQFTSAATFGEIVNDFIEKHCAVRNKPRTAAETERLLKRHWLPVFSRRLLQDVGTREISDVIDHLRETPGEAAHAFSAIRKFFNWARQRRLIANSPCAGLQLGFSSQTRSRVLSDDELMRVYHAAEHVGYPYGPIVQLLMLTAQRRNEIGSLRWSFIRQSERLIVLPPELVKNKREHAFAYGEMVACILAKLPRLDDLLFPARGHHDRAFSGWSKSKRNLDKICGVVFTLHDLRRTWATQVADMNVHPWVIEAHLNHVSGVVSGVAAIYNRHKYLSETRLAVLIFEQKLCGLLG